MAQFQPFNYGQAVGQGTSNALNTINIKNAQAQEGRQQTNFLNQQEKFSGDQQLENSKLMFSAFTEMAQRPESADRLVPFMKQRGLIKPDFDHTTMSMEQIQSTSAERAQALGAGLQAYGGGQQNKIGTYNPRDYTEGSLAKFRQSGNTSDLERYVAPRLETIGGVASRVDLGGQGSTTPLSTLEAEVGAERQLKGGAAQGKADVELKTKPEIEKQIALRKDDAKKAEAAFVSIDKIRANVLNLKDAAELVRQGASTGAIMSRLPSVRASSVALDSMQARLGLDVVGAVTFGALSKGELDLAKDVALPVKLKGEPLIAWIDNKIAAQTKLADYFEKQAVFLSKGGSQAEWVDEAKNIYGGDTGGDDLSIEDLLNKYGN